MIPDESPIFDALSSEPAYRDLPLYDAIAAAAIDDVMTGFDVLLTWARGEVRVSAPQWKPGDVALIQLHDGSQVALKTPKGWLFGDGQRMVEVYDTAPVPARPLVVIDPEDHEQIVAAWCQIHNALNAAGVVWDGTTRERTDAFQAALREFANPTPPRPDEPQGLGAVVEDASGQVWIRWEVVGRHPRPWTVPGSIKPNCAYADITVTRVLSEGWSE